MARKQVKPIGETVVNKPETEVVEETVAVEEQETPKKRKKKPLKKKTLRTLHLKLSQPLLQLLRKNTSQQVAY